jgi:hypothetical protein
MAKRSTEVHFNQRYFDRIMQTASVRDVVKKKAAEALAIAQATAPVDTGAYRDSLKLEQHQAQYRSAWRVVGTDKKTMLIEAKLGVLARALKQVKG